MTDDSGERIKEYKREEWFKAREILCAYERRKGGDYSVERDRIAEVYLRITCLLTCSDWRERVVAWTKKRSCIGSSFARQHSVKQKFLHFSSQSSIKILLTSRQDPVKNLPAKQSSRCLQSQKPRRTLKSILSTLPDIPPDGTEEAGTVPCGCFIQVR